MTLGVPAAHRPVTNARTISLDPKVTHMRPHPLVAVLLVATIALAACRSAAATPSREPAPSPEPSGAPTAGLDGRTFLSTGITGHGLVAGSQVRLAFQGGSLSANAGCNSMSGGYEVVDERLKVGPMATTEMACEASLMAQDQWLAAFLPDAGIVLDGDTLTLARDGVTLILTDRVVADPDRPLLGMRWVVESLVSAGAVSSVPVAVTAVLTFSDGKVDVESGCNRGRGSAEVADATITFGPIATTRMACPAPAMGVEAAVLAALEGEVAYAIEADTLMLEGDGSGLVLRAMP